MKRFALFPAVIGSDALIYIDGRFGYEKIRSECIKHAANIQKHHSRPILRAEIYTGSWFDRHCDYEIMFNEDDIKREIVSRG